MIGINGLPGFNIDEHGLKINRTFGWGLILRLKMSLHPAFDKAMADRV